MTDHKRSPFLGGRDPAPSGWEPSLSREQRPNRSQAVALAVNDLHSPVLHTRFAGVLALGSYADHDRAVAAVIRALHDSSLLVRFAAIFVLGQIGPRLINPLLRQNAVETLTELTASGSTLTIPSVAIEALVRAQATWWEASAGRALLETLLALPPTPQGRVVVLSEYAASALASIGAADSVELPESQPSEHSEQQTGSGCS